MVWKNKHNSHHSSPVNHLRLGTTAMKENPSVFWFSPICWKHSIYFRLKHSRRWRGFTVIPGFYCETSTGLGDFHQQQLKRGINKCDWIRKSSISVKNKPKADYVVLMLLMLHGADCIMQTTGTENFVYVFFDFLSQHLSGTDKKHCGSRWNSSDTGFFEVECRKISPTVAHRMTCWGQRTWPKCRRG